MNNRTRLGAAIWMFAVQFFVAQAVVQWGWTTPFSLSTNYISDLGNTVCAPYPAGSTHYVCSPWHVWMNVSFIALGLTKLIGSVFVHLAWQPGALKLTALGLLMVAGAGDILVGVYPENVDIGPHRIGAGLTFIGGNLAIALLGALILVQRWPKALGAVSIVLGLAGLVATVLMVKNIFLGLGVGGMERVAGYPVPIFLTAAGFHIFRTRDFETMPHARPGDAS